MKVGRPRRRRHHCPLIVTHTLAAATTLFSLFLAGIRPTLRLYSASLFGYFCGLSHQNRCLVFF